MSFPDPILPGGRPTRRNVLARALAVPALASVQASPAGVEKVHPAPTDLEAFLSRWIPRAHALVKEEQPAEDPFLWELCADLARLELAAFPRRSVTVFSADGMKTGPAGGDDVLQLIELELDPGAVVPAHNHVGYAFVTLCLGGEARVRHYEPEPGAPGPQELERDFPVREVQDVLLRPGRFSTLTRTRANVHTIVAGPEGVRLLDLGLKFPPGGAGPTAFSVLEVEPQPSDGIRGIHTARWIGNIYAKDYRRKK